MKFIETTGKTVDEALEKALNELNVSKDKVKVDILDEGSKGFLNIIGTKPAKIKVTVKYDYINEARLFTENLLSSMKVTGTVSIKEKKDSLYIDISGPKMGTIIGYRGETLDSIQYLISLVVNKNHEMSYKKVILDTENYRAKREQTLKAVALKTAHKVRRSKKPFKLEPMNPYERRIIHAALQNEEGISTYSEGEDPYRKVVVVLN
ncbi:MAG: RNA-binding cell elongation regulator Jag/EloR [Clostridium sp.]|uniref:RNA-binding cell elongation regulator Jag/EloR n=1 Tax=Clostridium sp. TaxID=1506 RepID=UPI003EE6219A